MQKIPGVGVRVVLCVPLAVIAVHVNIVRMAVLVAFAQQEKFLDKLLNHLRRNLQLRQNKLYQYNARQSQKKDPGAAGLHVPMVIAGNTVGEHDHSLIMYSLWQLRFLMY